MTAIQEAELAGFDLSLVDESLRRTPEERALQHQAALEMALQLEAAFRSTIDELNGDGTQPTSATPLRR